MCHRQQNKCYPQMCLLAHFEATLDFAVVNLLAHNNKSQICYCGRISLQSAAVFQTPLGVTFILLVMVSLLYLNILFVQIFAWSMHTTSILYKMSSKIDVIDKKYAYVTTLMILSLKELKAGPRAKSLGHVHTKRVKWASGRKIIPPYNTRESRTVSTPDASVREGERHLNATSGQIINWK